MTLLFYRSVLDVYMARYILETDPFWEREWLWRIHYYKTMIGQRENWNALS